MTAWLRRLFAKRGTEQPLKGKPPVRRGKAYSADTGYVYQYFYEGYREARLGDDAGDEYVFTVSSDRSSHFPVTLFLSHRVRDDWQQARGRELNRTEQYALIKMMLFQTFDERVGLGDAAIQVTVTYDNIEEHATTLDFV